VKLRAVSYSPIEGFLNNTRYTYLRFTYLLTYYTLKTNIYRVGQKNCAKFFLQ